MARSEKTEIPGDQEPLVLHTAGGEMPDVDAIERRAGRSSNGLMPERAEVILEEPSKSFFRPAVWLSFGLLGAAAAIYFLVNSRRAKGVRYAGEEFFEVA